MHEPGILLFNNHCLRLYRECNLHARPVRVPLPVAAAHDFSTVLCSAINDTIQEFLGPGVLEDLHEELRTKYGVSSDELPYRTMYDILETKFGSKE